MTPILVSLPPPFDEVVVDTPIRGEELDPDPGGGNADSHSQRPSHPLQHFQGNTSSLVPFIALPSLTIRPERRVRPLVWHKGYKINLFVLDEGKQIEVDMKASLDIYEEFDCFLSSITTVLTPSTFKEAYHCHNKRMPLEANGFTMSNTCPMVPLKNIKQG